MEAARTLGAERRREILAQAIAVHLASPGTWRVEQQTDMNAILVRGKPVNHVLHLLLSLLTLGLWLFVWIPLMALGGETRYCLAVDDHGNESFVRLDVWRRVTG
jgi:hypothetical protein